MSTLQLPQQGAWDFISPAATTVLLCSEAASSEKSQLRQPKQKRSAQSTLLRQARAVSFRSCIPLSRKAERAIKDGPVAVLRPTVYSASGCRSNVVRCPSSFLEAREDGIDAEVDSQTVEIIQRPDAIALSVPRFGLHLCNVRWLQDLCSVPLRSWPQICPQAAQLWDILGTLLSAATPLAGGVLGAAAGGGLSLAFCPFPLTNSFSLSSLQKHLLHEPTLKDLQTGIVVATFVQGSMGVVRILLGDVFGGCYTLLLATLGFNARRPGPASNWLKTYVLLTFINGTMSSIDLVQSKLLQTFPVVQLAALPLSVNMLHAAQLLVPAISFFGAYCGWQHIKMQRRLQREAYQQRLLLLMENTPWPPPPLPGMSLPGMPQVMSAVPGFPAPMQAAQQPAVAQATRTSQVTAHA